MTLFAIYPLHINFPKECVRCYSLRCFHLKTSFTKFELVLIERREPQLRSSCTSLMLVRESCIHNAKTLTHLVYRSFPEPHTAHYQKMQFSLPP